MADPRMMNEKELARWRAAYADAAKPCLCKEFLDHIAVLTELRNDFRDTLKVAIAENTALAEQLAAANHKLDDIQEYGIDTRNYGDGDANALWGRVDDFRNDPDANLSSDDVRELAEWWAELHHSLFDLDDKLCVEIEQLAAANQAREQAETQLSAWRKAFATNQLTHAKAESEAIRAENKRVRAERDALAERLDNSVKAVLDINSAIVAEDATVQSIREARSTAGFLRVVVAEGGPVPEVKALRRASEDFTEGEGDEGEDECRVCGGEGGIPEYTCEACGGTGKIRKAAAKEGETP